MFTVNLVEENVAPAPAVAAPAEATPSPANKQFDEVLARIDALQARQNALATPVAVQAAPEVPAIDSTDFLLDPAGSVAKVVAATMQRQQWEKDTSAKKAADAVAAVKAVVPDVEEVIQSAEFKQFLAATPAAKSMYEQGLSSVDPSSVSLVLQLYKAKPAQAEGASTSEVTTASNTTGESSVKSQTFSRAALQAMMVKDPDQYERLSDQILAAYASGNVTP